MTVSTFKRRMEKKLGEKRKVRCHASFGTVVSFGDCLTVTAGLCFCTIWKEGSGGPPSEKFW